MNITKQQAAERAFKFGFESGFEEFGSSVESQSQYHEGGRCWHAFENGRLAGWKEAARRRRNSVLKKLYPEKAR